MYASTLNDISDGSGKYMTINNIVGVIRNLNKYLIDNNKSRLLAAIKALEEELERHRRLEL